MKRFRISFRGKQYSVAAETRAEAIKKVWDQNPSAAPVATVQMVVMVNGQPTVFKASGKTPKEAMRSLKALLK